MEIGKSSISNLKRLRLKFASIKNRVVFLKRCLSHKIIPKFLCNKCPIKSSRSNVLTKKYRLNLLKECHNMEKKNLFNILKKCDQLSSQIKDTLSTPDFTNVSSIVNKAYEREFLRNRAKLKAKFEHLQRQNLPPRLPTSTRTSTIKNPVLQLQKDSLPPEATSLLEKGPKFAITHKGKHMEIVHKTEMAAKSLEYKGEREKGEKLRQDVSHILHQSMNNPHLHKPNLTQTEQKGLKQLQNKIKEGEIAITPHDKGIGFVTLEPEKLKEKATSAFQNVTTNTPNRTKTVQGTIQRKLLKLKKEGKISEKDYKQIYPSGCTAPISYPLLKAHKQNKNYPARNIVSHRGCPQEALSSFLIPILRPLLRDSPLNCKNSFEFIQRIKSIKIENGEIMVSFDAEALYPSIPLRKCIEIINILLQRDETLASRTTLTVNDIVDLLNLCLSTSDFIYDGIHHTAEDSGPIGLSIMVIIAQIWMDHTVTEANRIAQQKGIAIPRAEVVYMDDINGILRQNAEGNAHILYAQCLSEVDPRLKFHIRN